MNLFVMESWANQAVSLLFLSDLRLTSIELV